MGKWERYHKRPAHAGLGVDATLVAIRRMGLTVSYSNGEFRVNTIGARADHAVTVGDNAEALHMAGLIADRLAKG